MPKKMYSTVVRKMGPYPSLWVSPQVTREEITAALMGMVSRMEMAKQPIRCMAAGEMEI